MKIKRIEINNFRNYCGYHEFLLDKDITILFGENGFGKSSFFDAIEWCMTNEIERFRAKDGDLSFTNYDCVNQLNRNEKNANCYVSIYYNQYKLHRVYEVNTNQTKVYLYEIEEEVETLIARGQKNVEKYLYKNKQDSEIFGRDLIKHSYILSQDQVTNFIRSSPKERFDSLASIMGLNKITNFIDNLKTYYSALDSFCNDLQKELITKKQLLEDRSVERLEYHSITTKIQELKRKINYLYAREESQNMDFERVNNWIQDVANKLIKSNQQLSVLNEIPNSYTSYNELQEKLKNVEIQLEKDNNLLLRVNNANSSVIESLKSTEHEIGQITRHKGLIKNIDEQKKQIDQLKESIAKLPYNQQNMNEINDNFYRNYRKLQMANYALQYYKQFNETRQSLKQTPLEIEKNKKSISSLERKIQRTRKRIIQIKTWLDNNDGASSLQVLVKQLQGIYKYIKSNDTMEVCPVCSTSIGKELESRISNNISQFTSKVSEKELLLMRVFELKERKDKQLSIWMKECENYEREVNILTSKLKDNEEFLEKIITNEQYSKTLFNAQFITQIENIKSTLLTRIKSLEDVRDNKKNFEALNENYKSLLKSVNISKADGNLETSLNKRKGLLSRKHRRLTCLHKNIKNEIETLRREQVYLISFIQKIGIHKDLTNNQYKFEELKLLIEKEKTELNHKQTALNTLKDSFVIQREKEASVKVITRHEKEVNDLNETLENWQSKKENLNKYLKDSTSNIGEHAVKFLNHPNSKIQQYYRYLNPVPTMNGKIQFITDSSDEKKRGLIISIPFIKENGEEDLLNAKYTLSSAQLNTLAIAIFLVVNEAQDIGVFDFVAIDDPIQNMDDVNRYTMCDILGEIKKQIIFSTHDLSFLKLFIKKNEHKKKDIRVYFLENPNLLEGKVREVTF
ncbi:AAA family ATPase [Priestia aryabhattai]|uniref:AAA family ATPase n=1 Tax=Priestia aryabhattai TaxID=412384 RepID=UPI001CCB3B6E|nr:SMC family ATPase [Priestia aryabhattai]MBZ6489536.1 SMC family ATPase [Priestia aryabhattai]